MAYNNARYLTHVVGSFHCVLENIIFFPFVLVFVHFSKVTTPNCNIFTHSAQLLLFGSGKSGNIFNSFYHNLLSPPYIQNLHCLYRHEMSSPQEPSLGLHLWTFMPSLRQWSGEWANLSFVQPTSNGMMTQVCPWSISLVCELG